MEKEIAEEPNSEEPNFFAKLLFFCRLLAKYGTKCGTNIVNAIVVHTFIGKTWDYFFVKGALSNRSKRQVNFCVSKLRPLIIYYQCIVEKTNVYLLFN